MPAAKTDAERTAQLAVQVGDMIRAVQDESPTAIELAKGYQFKVVPLILELQSRVFEQRDRAVYEASWKEGFTYRQMADLLGLSKSMIQKAVQRIKRVRRLQEGD